MKNSLKYLKECVKEMELIDLSHTMEVNMPACPGHPKFFHNVMESHTIGDDFCHYQLIMGEHTGTHIDAPLHKISNGSNHFGIDKVPLSSLMGKAVKISVPSTYDNKLLSKEFVKKWESNNICIEPGDIVLIDFDWDKFWNIHPDDKNFLSDYPGLDADAANYFVEKKVSAVGTDALSLDVFGSSDSPTHEALLGNGIFILENLSNLKKLSIISYFICLPLKIKNGSGSPIRAVALNPKDNNL